MISVLIPVYNYDITELVSDLDNQLKKTNHPYEILVYNDGSNSQYTAALNQHNGVPHLRLIDGDINKGIIHARSTLAAQAVNEWLLFLDADAKIISPAFVNNYLLTINANNHIVTGGTSYPAERPSCNKMLHWKYGRLREIPSPGFKSINFLIRRSLFLKIDFPLIPAYGHEDTWMGIQFDQMKISVLKIDNPVLHSGLSENEKFLERSVMAINNVIKISAQIDDRQLAKHIRLFSISEKIRSLGLSGLVLFFNDVFSVQIKKNLLSCRPSLFLFDFFRMGEYFRKLKIKN